MTTGSTRSAGLIGLALWLTACSSDGEPADPDAGEGGAMDAGGVAARDARPTDRDGGEPPVVPSPFRVDHTSLPLFDQIPDDVVADAASLKILFRHASVGNNISDGLDCLENDFEQRPNFCDRDLAPEQIVYDPKYERESFVFEFHRPPPGQNPAWWDKAQYFIDRVEEIVAEEESEEIPGDQRYRYFSFKFGYVDAWPDSDIAETFFDPNANKTNIGDLEALEADHPDTPVVLWTLALARLSYEPSRDFNDALRAYAADTDHYLLDVAAIGSHRPDGSLCTSNDGSGVPALCDEYTEEQNGGHLNALGRLRMAKAFWILMARLSGWEPESAG